MDKKQPSKAEKQLERVRKDLKAFWELLNSKENQSIYFLAANHGIQLSKEYVDKIAPITARLKKFINIK
jgi:hypothetical protein